MKFEMTSRMSAYPSGRPLKLTEHPMALVNPDIFKAYDVRGIYPDQVNEDGARAIGAAFVAYLKAKRIAVGRDMRLSSPSLAQAFIDGATSQGADVVDYGMIADRHAVLRRRARRPRRRRADHRVAQSRSSTTA